MLKEHTYFISVYTSPISLVSSAVHKGGNRLYAPSLRYPQNQFSPDLDKLQGVLQIKKKSILPGYFRNLSMMSWYCFGVVKHTVDDL
jgi:hypothetical protein